MTAVNPPPQPRYPKSIAEDPQARSYFDSINRIILQLWKRTGGASDLVDDSIQLLANSRARTLKNSARIEALEGFLFIPEEISSNTTTEPFRAYNCTNSSSINVTLDPNAIKGDQIHIKRSNAAVIVVGDIDDDTNKTINVKYYSMHLIFNGAKWIQI